MENKKILIVEDEAIVAKDIAGCLKRLNYHVLSIFSKGEQALLSLEEEVPDLILMDIMLAGDITGIETAAEIKKRHNIPIVFLTAYADEKTISKAKVMEPYGYVIKPFKEIDLKASLEMALYKFQKNKEQADAYEKSLKRQNMDSLNDYLYVKSNSKLIKVSNENIYFVEALKDYVTIHSKHEKYVIHSTMKDLEKKLPTETFIRVHRSFIINLNKIKTIEGSLVQLEDYEQLIPIGGSFKEELYGRINLA